MFTIKEDQYFEYADDIDLDVCDFVSFLNLLLENKSSLNEILHSPIKTKNFSLIFDEKPPFLVLDICHNSTKHPCSRLLIDSSLKNSSSLFQSLKQLFLKSAQNYLSYKITPPSCGGAHAFPILGTQKIYVIKKQQFPSYTPKLVDLVKKHKRSAKILINKINYGNLWRARPKSEILTEGEVRLDLQGIDQEKFNYQMQTGRDTIATVLIDIAISKIGILSEQSYAVRKIKSGFQQSLDTLHVYKISFNPN